MITDPIAAFGLGDDIGFPAKPPGHLPPPIHDPLPTTSIQQAGDTGKRALWAVFVIMLIATIAFIGMAWSIPNSKRLYHVVTTFITLTAALSYFAMAVGNGISFRTIRKSSHSDHEVKYHYIEREVYWARYVDWLITTPLLLLDLGIIAGLSGGTLLITIIADVVMILTGLFAAFGHDGTQKWGWYAFGCLAYLVVVYELVVNGRAAVQNKGGKVLAFYSSIGGFTLLLWTVYPIVWGFADGSLKASVDAEIIAYAVLDVLAKPVFGFWLLFTHLRLPETNVELSGFWDRGFKSEGTIRIGEDDDGA